MTAQDNRGSTKLEARNDLKYSDPNIFACTEGERLICTQRVASVLSGVHTFIDVASAVNDEIVAFIGATSALLVLADGSCPLPILPGKKSSAYISPHAGDLEPPGISDIASGTVLRPLVEAIRSKMPVTITTPEEYLHRFPGTIQVEPVDKESVGGLTEQSLLTCSSVALPLLIEDQVVGGLLFVFDRWRTFNESELFFHKTMAHLCALAIVRIQLAEKELQARRKESVEREELQRALTASQNAQEALRESTQFIQKIADASPGVLYLYDMIEGRNVYGNRTLGTMLGYSDAEVQEMGPSMFERLVHPEDRMHIKCVMEMLKKVPDARVIEVEYRLRHRDGGYRWLLDRCTVFSRLSDGTAKQFVGVSQDITVRRDHEQRLRDANEFLRIFSQTMERQLALIQEQTALLEMKKTELEETNSRLASLATTDGLTGLTNHRTFHEKLSDEYDRCRRYGGDLSLLMMDVDHFKAFNDRFGHPAGDVMLKQIARVLMANTRTCDVLARYGGEEFGVVLPETDAEGAKEVAERIRGAVERSLWIGERMTISIGIVSKSILTMSAHQMVEEADRALYDCKARGRNTVVHYADMVGRLTDGKFKYFP